MATTYCCDADLNEDALSVASTDISELVSFSRVPTKSSTEEALIFFDWDDTLFPTSFLGALGLLESMGDPRAEVAEQLERLADAASATLSRAKARGRVVVVTNAGAGWVEMSYSKYMPSLQADLQDIEIISARASYEQHNLFAPTEWKCGAFSEQMGAFGIQKLADQRPSVISIGDSIHEREALLWATEGSQGCWGKVLKFVDRPSLEQMVEQHQLVADCLDEVIDHFGPMDYEVGLDQE